MLATELGYVRLVDDQAVIPGPPVNAAGFAMNDDLDARTKQFAKDLLDALDREDDPDRLAYTIQKESEDRAALEQFYVRTGQRPAPGESESVVAVWDYASRPEATFAIGVLTANGVARYEYKKLPKRNRPATRAAMRRRGVLSAASYAGADFVWLVDDGGFGVWSTKAGLIVSANTDEVLFEDACVPRGDVKAIHTFVSHDYVVRGIRIERADGAHLPLVSERDAIAEADPTYGRNELLESDARWISYCGRDLSIALRVPLVDQVFGVTADPVIAAVLRELAAQIELLPETGEFGAIEQPFVHGDQRVVLRCAPSPADPERKRFVELRVGSESGQSTTSQWLLAGSNGELGAYLRWPETVEDIPRHIRELVVTQQQHRMG